MLLHITKFHSFSKTLSYSIIYNTCNIFFIHLSVDEHLGCFHMLAVVNNVTINSSVLTALWASVLVFFRQISWEELLDHMVVLCLIFLRKLHTVPQITILIYVPTDCAQEFPFPHISLQHLLCIVIVIIAILKDGSLWFWFTFLGWLQT